MKQDIEVFVTDLDHTLLHPETEELLDELPGLLQRWMKEDNIWIIATGRQQDHLERFLNELEILPNYYITRSRYIHSGQAKDHPALDQWNSTIRDLTNKQESYTKTWIPAVNTWASDSDITVESQDGYVMFDSAESAEKAFHFLTDFIDDSFKVLRNRRFLIVVPGKTGKGNCLKHLCETMNWQESELFCVGDGMNDANMLDGDYDFRKAVVANAEPQLKDLVTQHGGVILEHVGGHAIVSLLKKLLKTHVEA